MKVFKYAALLIVVFGAGFALTANATTVDVGILPLDGTPIEFISFKNDDEFDIFNFTLTENIGDPGSFFNIQTYFYNTFTTDIDTGMALYHSAGARLAFDDDGNFGAANGYGDYDDWGSQLSFGFSDPHNVPPFSSHPALLAGDYSLVVGHWTADFTFDIGNIDPTDEEGLYAIRFQANYNPVPVPPSVLLLASGLFATGIGFRSRRKKKSALIQK